MTRSTRHVPNLLTNLGAIWYEEYALSEEEKEMDELIIPKETKEEISRRKEERMKEGEKRSRRNRKK
jgi:hypothetical protein